MPRDVRGIIDKVFADTGDVADPTFNFEEGWPIAYSQAGGQTPEREVFNKLFQILYAVGHDVTRFGGALPWDAAINYVVPAVVSGADGKLYLAVNKSGPGVAAGAVNPVDDEIKACWSVVGPPPDASEVLFDNSASGLTDGQGHPANQVQMAIDALADNLDLATENKAGIAERATQAEVDAGVDDERFVTPHTLNAWRRIKSALIVDQQPDGTRGGPSTGNWDHRVLNTIKYDNIGITIADNEVTIPAGTYRFVARASGKFTNRCKSRLYNTSLGSVIDWGARTWAYQAYGGDTRSGEVDCLFTCTSPTTIRLESRTEFVYAEAYYTHKSHLLGGPDYFSTLYIEEI